MMLYSYQGSNSVLPWIEHIILIMYLRGSHSSLAEQTNKAKYIAMSCKVNTTLKLFAVSILSKSYLNQVNINSIKDKFQHGPKFGLGFSKPGPSFFQCRQLNLRILHLESGQGNAKDMQSRYQALLQARNHLLRKKRNHPLRLSGRFQRPQSPQGLQSQSQSQIQTLQIQARA